MKKSALCFAVLCASCATPYAQVKKVRTIDEARALLGDYKPSVTPYPPDAEAWYFGGNECVLFVDGKLRMSRDAHTETQGANTAKQPRVLCSPSEAHVTAPECVACPAPYKRVKKARTIEEARDLLGDFQPTVTPYSPDVEAWYFGPQACVLFVDGKLRMSRDTSTEVAVGAATPDQTPVVCSPAEADANDKK